MTGEQSGGEHVHVRVTAAFCARWSRRSLEVPGMCGSGVVNVRKSDIGTEIRIAQLCRFSGAWYGRGGNGRDRRHLPAPAARPAAADPASGVSAPSARTAWHAGFECGSNAAPTRNLFGRWPMRSEATAVSRSAIGRARCSCCTSYRPLSSEWIRPGGSFTWNRSFKTPTFRSSSASGRTRAAWKAATRRCHPARIVARGRGDCAYDRRRVSRQLSEP
jgi:hypothetical protein